jgi:hypothetical protein
MAAYGADAGHILKESDGAASRPGVLVKRFEKY